MPANCGTRGLLTGLRLSELLALDLGGIDGRPSERRLEVAGKGRKERFVPIEAALEEVLTRYLETRRARFPNDRRTPSAPLFVDRKGARLRPGVARYLVAQCYRHAGVGARVPRGALVHALRHTFGTRPGRGRRQRQRDPVSPRPRFAQHLSGLRSTAAEQRLAARANRTYRSLEHIVPGRRNLNQPRRRRAS